MFLSELLQISIPVLDLNDNFPQFNFTKVTYYVNEDAESDTFIVLISAEDKDQGKYSGHVTNEF